MDDDAAGADALAGGPRRFDPRSLAADASAAAALTTLPLHALESADHLLTPLGLLTAGLVLLAITPMVTVLIVMVAYSRGGRWREAAMAACVFAILALSVVLRPHG